MRLLRRMAVLLCVPGLAPAAGQQSPDSRLLDAARKGDVAEVRAALLAGANINVRTQERRIDFTLYSEGNPNPYFKGPANFGGETALILAAGGGHLEAVGALLQAGADPSLRSASGASVLASAVKSGKRDLVGMLLSAGCDPRADDGVVREAAGSGDSELVRMLVEAGAPIGPALEVSALRRLGERHRIGFSLQKTVRPQRVGDIALQLTRTDAKRQTYTVRILIGDKLVEKRDKAVNQAVQFYVAKSRQPYELVVTRVERDRLEGYLSVPGSLQPGIGK